MWQKVVIMSLVFNLVISGPLSIVTQTQDTTTAKRDDITTKSDVVTTKPNEDSPKTANANTKLDAPKSEAFLMPVAFSAVVTLISKLVGVDPATVSIAAKTLGWALTNAFGFGLGVLSTFGLCMFLHKCNMIPKEFPMKDVATTLAASNVDAHQNILFRAIERFGGKKEKTEKKVKDLVNSKLVVNKVKVKAKKVTVKKKKGFKFLG